ncbi:hypothetical protein HZR84_03785 [Hyphobacterium sp. CCMP332]|nr:hypothetical protein HZR84_03785 [Hyphobacterium sp. CCMP332]
MPDNFPQDKSSGDYYLSIGKALAGLVGTGAAELFDLILTPPLQKRQAEWLNGLHERIKSLEQEKLITLEDLSNNDVFINLVLKATSEALKTHKEEKIKAYQNIIINSIIDTSLDEFRANVLINFLNSLTTWHIDILSFLDAPYKRKDRVYEGRSTDSLNRIILDAYPQLKKEKQYHELIWNDLVSYGLIEKRGLKDMFRGGLSGITTPLGKELLHFISDPEIKT